MIDATSQDGTVVPKHIGMMKNYTIIYVVCAFSWFSKKIS
jgi:hypothetical protein